MRHLHAVTCYRHRYPRVSYSKSKKECVLLSGLQNRIIKTRGKVTKKTPRGSTYLVGQSSRQHSRSKWPAAEAAVQTGVGGDRYLCIRCYGAPTTFFWRAGAGVLLSLAPLTSAQARFSLRDCCQLHPSVWIVGPQAAARIFKTHERPHVSTQPARGGERTERGLFRLSKDDICCHPGRRTGVRPGGESPLPAGVCQGFLHDRVLLQAGKIHENPAHRPTHTHSSRGW